jgi:hypothetical protein
MAAWRNGHELPADALDAVRRTADHAHFKAEEAWAAGAWPDAAEASRELARSAGLLAEVADRRASGD